MTADRSGRVLVVDDDPRLARSYQRILQRAHEVQLADSGKAAIRLLERDSAFDVIICDLMMPDVSGIDVFRWIQQHLPQLGERVVFISGGACTEAVLEFLDSVDNRRLQKPVMPADFRALVAGLMRAAPRDR
jgi:DNA-binding response OmpR family regulator